MNEYELLYAIHLMDEEAVELLIQQYQKRIRQMIRKVEHEVNYVCATSDEGEEMLQIATLALLRAVDNYCDEGIPFQCFALKCVEMAIKKHIRSQRSRSNYLNDHALSLDCAIQEESSTYHIEAVENNQKEFEPQYMLDWYYKENIMTFLSRELSSEELKVVELMLEGYRHKEIGLLLSKSHRNVAYIVHKVKKLLLTYIDYEI